MVGNRDSQNNTTNDGCNYPPITSPGEDAASQPGKRASSIARPLPSSPGPLITTQLAAYGLTILQFLANQGLNPTQQYHVLNAAQLTLIQQFATSTPTGNY